MSSIAVEQSEKLIDDMLKVYPEKVAKNRRKHLAVKSCEIDNHIEANTKVIPGIATNRGCSYAGAKGVVMGPIKDVLCLTHGPIGCGYYTWGTRRNFAKAEDGQDNYMQYCVSTDMQETDVVFGGEKKLKQAIDEVVKIFNPGAICIFATCPVGLIGDDIDAVALEAGKEHGITVMAARCEGYRGVSQSSGHHIANNIIMEHLVGTEELKDPTPFDINIFGEYNIGGDLWEIKPLFEKLISVPEAGLVSESRIQLKQNTPNPFDRTTQIKWKSDVSGHTVLKVFNIKGQEITALINKYMPIGEHSVAFDGSRLGAGVYYYRLSVGQFSQTKKMILMK